MKLSLLSLPVASAFVIPQAVLHGLEEVFQLASDEVPHFALPLAPFKNHTRPSYDELPPVDTEALQSLITHDALNASAIELFRIANSSTGMMGHPTRVIGSPGHWQTLDWIRAQLSNMSDYYTYSTQEFEALDGKIFNYSLAIDYVKVDEVKPFQLSPPAHVYGADVFVVANEGCDDVDYAGLSELVLRNPWREYVTLVKRGSCPFGDKSALSGKYGAHAALIYDPTSSEMIPGTLGAPTKTTVGTMAISKKIAEVLLAKKTIGPVYINMFIASYVGIIKTQNIIADTIHGDKENVVALGAHSDSVEAGPGINDDGSGTISLINVAKALSNFQVNNTVRFAWWAAEEEGLLGSNFYAYNLTEAENQKIRLFMDYDMMASPNFQYQVYNGSNDVNPVGSEELKQLYIDYYESKGLDWSLIEFDGRSDYVGFIETGIPGGGIATGAEGLNPYNNRAFDECYHELCDDLGNLAWDAFLVNTQLIAHSVATYASDLTGFPAREVAKATSEESEKVLPQFALRGNHYIF